MIYAELYKRGIDRAESLLYSGISMPLFPQSPGRIAGDEIERAFGLQATHKRQRLAANGILSLTVFSLFDS